jgi:hypothetical protein
MNRIEIARLILGATLLALGVGALIASVFVVPPFSHDLRGLGLLLVLIAGPLLYPSMLREGSESVSAMRVVVYIVVGIFAVVTFRAAWMVTTLADLEIDPWWTAIVSAAITGKAVQSFSEPAGGAKGKPAGRPSTPAPLPPRPPAGARAPGWRST